MQKHVFVIVLFFLFCNRSNAQFTRFIIQLKNKGTNPYSLSNPAQYLSQRALDRRSRYNIPIDSTDLPITPRYIDSIRMAGSVTIINVSKWLNQVAVETTDDAAITRINNFPFVVAALPIAARISTTAHNKRLDIPSLGTISTSGAAMARINGYYDYGASAGQVKIHNADFLHNHGFRGEGMQMAILDAGFYHYLSLPTFDSIRTNNQVLGTWDFVANEASVDEDYYHGMQCLSTIAANIPGTFVGTAPKTSFYLYRTEDTNTEYPIEEQNWAAAMERADSLGVDISSTSLGYTEFDNSQFNHTYADMNGNTTICARAADLAAKKGILLVAAAGNEGNSSWHFISTPADADSVLSVGAVGVDGIPGSFSSYGPSSDGQIKPSVAAVGVDAVVANTATGQPSFNSGTSFACPNMAGITTCLWQSFPEINNMGIIKALELSGSRSANPDDRMGYGIADVKKAFVILQRQLYTLQSSSTDCNATFQFNIKTDNTMSIVVERQLAAENAYLTVGTLQSPEPYGLHSMVFTDDLSNIIQGTVNYRFKLVISSDTTFYLDSMSINHSQSCNGVTPSDNVTIVQQQLTAENIDVVINRTTTAKINIVVVNALGQRVYSSEFEQVAGRATRHLNLTSIVASKAAYFITVYVNNKKVVTREIFRP